MPWALLELQRELQILAKTQGPRVLRGPLTQQQEQLRVEVPPKRQLQEAQLGLPGGQGVNAHDDPPIRRGLRAHTGILQGWQVGQPSH